MLTSIDLNLANHLVYQALFERDVKLELEFFRHLLKQIRAAAVLAAIPQVLVECSNPFLEVLGNLAVLKAC